MKTKLFIIALISLMATVNVNAFEINCINSTTIQGCGVQGQRFRISGTMEDYVGGRWQTITYGKTWTIGSETGCFTLNYIDEGLPAYFENAVNLWITWYDGDGGENMVKITEVWISERLCDDPSPVEISCVNHEYIRGTAAPLSLFMVSITQEEKAEVFAGFRANEDGEFRCELKGLGLPEWLEGCTLNFYKVEDSGWSVEIEDLEEVVSDPTPIQAPVAPALTVKVYPNPTTDILNISSERKITKTEVFSLLGKRILSDKSGQANIDIANLDPGTYIIQVHTLSGVTSSKFVKN